jgi:DNA-binding transcriptional ArsR family regulator
VDQGKSQPRAGPAQRRRDWLHASDLAPRTIRSPFESVRNWGFITSHARVLLAVARNPELRIEGIAEAARVTRRSVYRILSDLVEAGYLRRSRNGTRNLYQLDPELPLGDPVVEAQPVGDLLSLVER